MPKSTTQRASASATGASAMDSSTIVTVTGGAGRAPISLSFDSGSFAELAGSAAASFINAELSQVPATVFNPSSPPSPSVGGAYLLVPPSDEGHSVSGLGFGVIVVDNPTGPVTVTGGGSSEPQITLADTGGLTYSATTGDDFVIAAGGNNHISFAGDKDPTLAITGGGNDTIVGGAAATTIDAGGGHNLIVLQAGQASITVEGQDTVNAGSGSATIGVSSGSVVVRGSTGVLNVNGGSGSATVTGGAGGGVFVGGTAGENVLMGGSGNVTLVGGGANDRLVAGTGDSTLKAAAANGNTLVAGAFNATLIGDPVFNASFAFLTPGANLNYNLDNWHAGDVLKLGSNVSAFAETHQSVGPAGDVISLGAAGNNATVTLVALDHTIPNGAFK